jgi:alpha-L-fucosidase
MDDMWGGQSTRHTGDARLKRFLDEKYAMFIHWGLYSIPGGEWRGKTYRGIAEWIMHPALAGIPVEEYKALAETFNPTAFDAQNIARLAKDAGMRCIVITAKHHEGFAMFDSAHSDFTITRATPFGRDPMRELAEACRKEGLRLGFYYSQFQDWIEPDGGGSRCPPNDRPADFERYFSGKAVPQITELLTNYGPIAAVWFDLVHKLQPECLNNSRIGNGLGDYSTLGDMEIPTKTPEDNGAYECIDTTNDSWAYARHDKHWKAPVVIARSLVRVAARGCRFMLNVGPRGDGTIPEEAVHSLRVAGEWVRAHAESIYGTEASPFPPFAWGDCTVRGQYLYVHIFDWPHSGRLRLASLANRVEKAEFLATGDAVPFCQVDGVLTLELPVQPPEPVVTVIRLTLDGAAAALDQDLVVDGEFTTNLRAEYAETKSVALTSHRWMETFGEWKKSEHLTHWHDASDRAEWHLNVLQPGTYSVTVEYACTPEAEGAEWQIATDSDVISFAVLDTGLRAEAPSGRRRRMRYRKIEQGVLRFAHAGRQKLVLSPVGHVEGLDVCIKQVLLAPWE